jgi:hypothetical protein
VHLAGDQHLPAVVQYGIDAHRDGPVAFAGPAVNVGYPRWWEPAKTGRNKTTGNPNLTGDFLDHFGHPLTVLAVKNGPYEFPKPILESVQAKTSGLGIARFNKAKRTITFECWPYLADVSKPGSQMETWPVTVKQSDNYARPPAAHLPEVRVRGLTNPVLQVFDEATGELVYALRISGSTFRPHVFTPGKYRIVVGDQDANRMQRLEHITAPRGSRSSAGRRVLGPAHASNHHGYRGFRPDFLGCLPARENFRVKADRSEPRVVRARLGFFNRWSRGSRATNIRIESALSVVRLDHAEPRPSAALTLPRWINSTS